MPESGDRYDWLYQGKSHNEPPKESGELPPDLPPPNLPPAGGGDSPKRKRKPLRIALWTLLALVLVWSAFTVAVPMNAWSQIHRVDAFGDWTRPPEQPGQTFLVVGSDQRPGETANGRTDTIMMLHWGSGPTVLTSIPRDSYVKIPVHGADKPQIKDKINAAYSYGGAPLLIQTVEQATGVRIDGYVEIGFNGLVDVVNAVGGITVCPTEDLNDPDALLNIKAGCQEVDGATALAYSRARHSRKLGDIGRAEAQREVIGAVGKKIASPSTILNPFKYAKVSSAGAKSLTINKDLGFFTFVQFGLKMSTVMDGNGLSCTVPLKTINGNARGVGSVVLWDEARSQEFFSDIASDKTDQLGGLCTADGFAAS